MGDVEVSISKVEFYAQQLWDSAHPIVTAWSGSLNDPAFPARLEEYGTGLWVAGQDYADMVLLALVDTKRLVNDYLSSHTAVAQALRDSAALYEYVERQQIHIVDHSVSMTHVNDGEGFIRYALGTPSDYSYQHGNYTYQLGRPVPDYSLDLPSLDRAWIQRAFGTINPALLEELSADMRNLSSAFSDVADLVGRVHQGLGQSWSGDSADTAQNCVVELAEVGREVSRWMKQFSVNPASYAGRLRSYQVHVAAASDDIDARNILWKLISDTANDVPAPRKQVLGIGDYVDGTSLPFPGWTGYFESLPGKLGVRFPQLQVSDASSSPSIGGAGGSL